MVELKALTFDYWNTLMVQDVAAGRRLRRSMIIETLDRLGYTVDPELIDAGFDAAANQFHNAWKAGEQFVLADGVAVLRRFLGTSSQHDDELIATWIRCGHQLELTPVEPDLGATLAALSARGLALGIICDVGLMPSPVLLEHLERHDLRRHFVHCSFSDEVGFYKPASEIFAHSHAGLGVEDPAQSLHIGDLRRTDVAGARTAGSVSARYRGVVDDDGIDEGSQHAEADYVVTSHAELLDLV